jgi:hypothetical protein
MLTRLDGPCRERQRNRGNSFVSRLEPLEDRLTPSSIPPLLPEITNQLAVSEALVTQEQSAQPPSKQLFGAFLFFYAQSVHQNPIETNNLMLAESVLVTDLALFAIDAQLQVTDPSLSNSFMNVQNTVVNSPIRATPAGAAANVLVLSLCLPAEFAPSTQSLIAAFEFSYTQAYRQDPSKLGALNQLVMSEVVLSQAQNYSSLGPVFQFSDPTLAATQANAQMAIAANPVHNTTFGALTGQLAQSLVEGALIASE